MRKLSGGAGPFFLHDGSSILNDTEHPIELHAGYRTTACGYADSIVLMPNEVGRKVCKGGPRDFSSWEMQEYDEYNEEVSVDFRVSEVPNSWWR